MQAQPKKSPKGAAKASSNLSEDGLRKRATAGANRKDDSDKAGGEGSPIRKLIIKLKISDLKIKTFHA